MLFAVPEMHPTNSPLLSRLVIVAARCVSLSKYATVQHCHYTYSAEFDSFTIPLHSSYVFSTVILLTVFGFCFWFRRPEQSLRSLWNEANSSVVPAVSTLIDLDQLEWQARESFDRSDNRRDQHDLDCSQRLPEWSREDGLRLCACFC